MFAHFDTKYERYTRHSSKVTIFFIPPSYLLHNNALGKRCPVIPPPPSGSSAPRSPASQSNVHPVTGFPRSSPPGSLPLTDVGQRGSGPSLVGRIGSGVRVSASFQKTARLVLYSKLVQYYVCDTKIELGLHTVH